MSQVLNISSDRKIFEEGSAVRTRVVEYGSLFEELHIIIFSKRNFQFSIFNFQSITKVQISKNCWVYPTNSLNRWFYIFNAIRIGKRIIENCKLKIENSRNDFIVSSQDPFECGFVALRLARRFKLPLHIQIHTDFLSPFFASSSFLNRIRVFIASRVLPQANAIRVVSQRIKDSLLQTTNYKLQTVPTVLPIFTDLGKFKNAKPVFSLQEKYPQWGFIILVVARLTAEKNVGFALRVLQELLKKYPKVGMVIVGEGSELSHLKLKTKNYNLQTSVAFEGWQSDLISYYKTANLFLQTSLYEGFGLSLLEALACGCPSVSSDVGIAPELLNHKGHSFVCPVNDRECFLSKISQLIDDNQLRTFFSTQIAPSSVNQFVQTKESYLQNYKWNMELGIRKPIKFVAEKFDK